MSNILLGTNEAERRLRALVNQTNHGGVDRPNGTNERGYPGREHHAGGDRVGLSNVEEEKHARGDRVGGSSAAPGRGGSHMSPHFGEPQKGRQTGHPRHMAAKQAHGENHAHGDRVGRQRHDMGDAVQAPVQGTKQRGQPSFSRQPMPTSSPFNAPRVPQGPKTPQTMASNAGNQSPEPQPLRRGGKPHPHHHRYER